MVGTPLARPRTAVCLAATGKTLDNLTICLKQPVGDDARYVDLAHLGSTFWRYQSFHPHSSTGCICRSCYYGSIVNNSSKKKFFFCVCCGQRQSALGKVVSPSQAWVLGGNNWIVIHDAGYTQGKVCIKCMFQRIKSVEFPDQLQAAPAPVQDIPSPPEESPFDLRPPSPVGEVLVSQLARPEESLLLKNMKAFVAGDLQVASRQTRDSLMHKLKNALILALEMQHREAACNTALLQLFTEMECLAPDDRFAASTAARAKLVADAQVVGDLLRIELFDELSTSDSKKGICTDGASRGVKSFDVIQSVEMLANGKRQIKPITVVAKWNADAQFLADTLLQPIHEKAGYFDFGSADAAAVEQKSLSLLVPPLQHVIICCHHIFAKMSEKIFNAIFRDFVLVDGAYMEDTWMGDTMLNGGFTLQPTTKALTLGNALAGIVSSLRYFSDVLPGTSAHVKAITADRWAALPDFAFALNQKGGATLAIVDRLVDGLAIADKQGKKLQKATALQTILRRCRDHFFSRKGVLAQFVGYVDRICTPLHVAASSENSMLENGAYCNVAAMISALCDSETAMDAAFGSSSPGDVEMKRQLQESLHRAAPLNSRKCLLMTSDDTGVAVAATKWYCNYYDLPFGTRLQTDEKSAAFVARVMTNEFQWQKECKETELIPPQEIVLDHAEFLLGEGEGSLSLPFFRRESRLMSAQPIEASIKLLGLPHWSMTGENRDALWLLRRIVQDAGLMETSLRDNQMEWVKACITFLLERHQALDKVAARFEYDVLRIAEAARIGLGPGFEANKRAASKYVRALRAKELEGKSLLAAPQVVPRTSDRTKRPREVEEETPLTAPGTWVSSVFELTIRPNKKSKKAQSSQFILEGQVVGPDREDPTHVLVDYERNHHDKGSKLTSQPKEHLGPAYFGGGYFCYPYSMRHGDKAVTVDHEKEEDLVAKPVVRPKKNKAKASPRAKKVAGGKKRRNR